MTLLSYTFIGITVAALILGFWGYLDARRRERKAKRSMIDGIDGNEQTTTQRYITSVPPADENLLKEIAQKFGWVLKPCS